MAPAGITAGASVSRQVPQDTQLHEVIPALEQRLEADFRATQLAVEAAREETRVQMDLIKQQTRELAQQVNSMIEHILAREIANRNAWAATLDAIVTQLNTIRSFATQLEQGRSSLAGDAVATADALQTHGEGTQGANVAAAAHAGQTLVQPVPVQGIVPTLPAQAPSQPVQPATQGEFFISRTSRSIESLWQEWSVGCSGHPPLSSMKKWKKSDRDRKLLYRRLAIVTKIESLLPTRTAADIVLRMEQLRGSQSLNKFNKTLQDDPDLDIFTSQPA